LQQLIALGAPAVAMILAAAVIVALSTPLARMLSSVLSRVFDRVTWYQLRQSALGNDTIGEIGSDASEAPLRLGGAGAPLPPALADELTKFSDAAAAQSLSKLRTEMQRLAFAEGRKDKSDVVEEYLTWDELIHTPHFKVPRFRKLICCAIAHSPGFKPSATFMRDPDYSLVSSWYKRLTPGSSAPNS
jgi:hypothetical protein